MSNEEAINEDRGLQEKLIFLEEQQQYLQNKTAAMLNILEDLAAARQKAEENETKFRTIFESASDGILLGDAETKRLCFPNRKICKMLGYTAKELESMSVQDIHPPEDVEWVLDAFERRRRGDLRSTEKIPMTRKDGSVFSADVTFGLLQLRGKTYVAGFFRDITERQKAQQQIREREAELASIFRAAPTGIGVVANRTLTKVNERLCKMTGYTEGELINQSAQILYPTRKDYDYVSDENCRQIREKGTGTVETRWVRKGRQIIDVLLNSTPFDPEDLSKGMTFTALDITARKLAEERFRSISEAAPMGMLTFDMQGDQLILTGFNKAATRYYPVPMEELVGLPIETAFESIKGTDIESQFIKLCREGGVWKKEQLILQIGGQNVIFGLAAFGISPGKMAVLFDDISAQIRMRDDLRESQRAMSTLLGNLPGIVYRCRNEPDWPMEFISEGCLETTGYSSEQFMSGRAQWNDIIHPDDQSRIWDEIQQALAQRKPFEIQYRIQSADGEEKWMWERGCGVYNDEEQAVALEGFISDFTDLKLTQDNLARRLRQEQLVAEISHTFANLPVDQIDTAIDQVLRKIAMGFRFERIRLAEFTEDQSRLFLSSHYSHIRDELPLIETEDMDRDTPYLAANIRNKEITWYSNLPEGLPPEARREREYIERYGIKSYVVVPLFVDPIQVGAILMHSCQRVALDQDFLNFLKVIAEILTNAILRKRNAKAIAESQQQFANLAKCSPMGIFLYELQADDRLVITDMNPAAEQILNIKKEACIEKSIEEVFCLLAETEVPERYRRLCREGGSWTVDQFDYLDAERPGPYSFHAFQISPGRLAVMFEDISERLRQQKALRLTQFAVEHSGESIFWIDKESRLFYVNEVSCKTLGYTKEELIGMRVTYLDPDFPEAVWPDHWRELKENKTLRFESHHKTKTGEIIPVEITANFVEFDGQEFNFAFVRDIRRRKAQQEAERKLLREVQGKNEELENIVFIASHDLRSPLVNIEGFTGELQKTCAELGDILDKTTSLDVDIRRRIEFLLNEDVPESLKFITAGTSKMDSLLAGLLRLSRIGTATLNIRPINMNNLIKMILGSMRYQIREEHVEIEVGDLPACMGDAVQVNQVFSNLIDNAMKYKHPDRACRIRIDGRVAEGMVVYSVEDNGIGIEQNHLGKIFEIFHQLNPGSGKRGEGLGLTIVRRILDRQDGKIWVESQSGAGSTFHVSLMAAAGRTSPV